MDSLEKFDYRNFGKFFNEIISNPDVVKKRDFLAEKALDWFEISADDIETIDKLEIVKNLYKYISLSFYLSFYNDPKAASKIDILSLKNVEREFPKETRILKKNTENWQYFLTYYSGIIDALSMVVRLKGNKSFTSIINSDDDEFDEDDDNE